MGAGTIHKCIYVNGLVPMQTLNIISRRSLQHSLCQLKVFRSVITPAARKQARASQMARQVQHEVISAPTDYWGFTSQSQYLIIGDAIAEGSGNFDHLGFFNMR